MNIYHLSQDKNRGYDTYSDMVVIADDEEQAKRLHPRMENDSDSDIYYNDEKKVWMNGSEEDCWNEWVSDLSLINIKEIGIAHVDETKARIVCASYHAG